MIGIILPRGLAFVVSLLLLPLGVQTAPTTTEIGLQVAPARLDLAIAPADSTITRQLSVANRGSSRISFSISAVDLVVHDGFPEALPPSSTPYSMAALTTINPTELTLDPGKSGAVKVAFDVSRHKPFLGAFVVTPSQSTTDTSSGSPAGRVGVVALPQALVTVSAAPVDALGELLPSVALGLEPVSLRLPIFAESGPLSATVTLKNGGNVYERILSTYQFSNLGRRFLTVEAPPTSAMPGQTARTSATTRQRLEAGGQAIDTAPWLCVCQVRVSTVAWLAGRQTMPVVQTATLIVFPWRVAGALLGLLVLAIASRWFWRRRPL